ncbi:hypothetical protein OCU04_007333 [Sclerotinia nivalis]|uniref:Uncharacterized protein n=1 Tax=Sclerotinia nivalis TaxID=352851 RepID=A0A9X0AII8_9HELO|nr:hypothetical protein OCU04_007333 [Sclerotinia nivalis]
MEYEYQQGCARVFRCIATNNVSEPIIENPTPELGYNEFTSSRTDLEELFHYEVVPFGADPGAEPWNQLSAVSLAADTSLGEGLNNSTPLNS